MKAVVLRGPRDLAVMDVPTPQAPAGTELIRVRACGICGSDLRYFVGENPWAKHTLGFEKPNPPNMILGHEIGGEHAGAPVSALAFKGCGQCMDCRRGRESLCAATAHLGHGAGWETETFNPGGMAEWCPVWSDFIYRLPAGMSCAEATFLDGLAVAVHAVRRASIFPGARIAVWGAGPIGLMILQTAKAFGAGAAVVADVYDTALACATEFGARQALSGEGGPEAVAEAVREATGGRGADCIFETTGDPAVQQAALGCLARGGTLMLMAGANDLSLSEGALAGERTVTTSSNHQYEDFQTALDLLAEGAVRVGPMITHRFPIDEAVRAFEVARHKERYGALKVIIEP